MNHDAQRKKGRSWGHPVVAGAIGGAVNFAVKGVPDAVVMRLRAHEGRIIVPGSFHASLYRWWHVVSLSGTPNAGMFGVLRSVGLAAPAAVSYKVAQGMMTYPLQQKIHGCLNDRLGVDGVSPLDMGMRGMFSGWLASMCELSLHPLDTLKNRALADPDVFKEDGGLVAHAMKNPRGLYSGVGIAAIRNSISNPAAWFVMAYLDAYFKQNTEGAPTQKQAALKAGAFTAMRLVVPYPLDTLKAIVQTQKEGGLTSLDIAVQRIKTTGIGGLYRGLLPKVISNYPALFLQMWIFQMLTVMLDSKQRPEDDSSVAHRL
jgi:hypothetical protein